MPDGMPVARPLPLCLLGTRWSSVRRRPFAFIPSQPAVLHLPPASYRRWPSAQAHRTLRSLESTVTMRGCKSAPAALLVLLGLAGIAAAQTGPYCE